MRFVDEYRDPAAAEGLLERIRALAPQAPSRFMEVCGGHTHTIYRQAPPDEADLLQALQGVLSAARASVRYVTKPAEAGGYQTTVVLEL